MKHNIIFSTEQDIQWIVNSIIARIDISKPRSEEIPIHSCRDHILLTTDIAHLKIKKNIVTLSCNDIEDMLMLNNTFMYILLIIMATTRFVVSAENDNPKNGIALIASKNLVEIKSMYSEDTEYLNKQSMYYRDPVHVNTPCKIDILQEELITLSAIEGALMLKDFGITILYTSNAVYNYTKSKLVRTYINLNHLGIGEFTMDAVEISEVDYHINSLINMLLEQDTLVKVIRHEE